MITEAELGRLLIYQADSDKTRRSVGWPTLEEGMLNVMEVQENLEALLDPFPWTPVELTRMWGQEN